VILNSNFNAAQGFVIAANPKLENGEEVESITPALDNFKSPFQPSESVGYQVLLNECICKIVHQFLWVGNQSKTLLIDVHFPFVLIFFLCLEKPKVNWFHVVDSGLSYIFGIQLEIGHLDIYIRYVVNHFLFNF
jgi:hypothetical protein